MRQSALFFAVALGLAAAPLQAENSGKVWRLGLLSPIEFELIRDIVLPRLARNGFVEGRNLVVDARVGAVEELPELARGLVAAKPDAIIAVSDWAILPAREATKTVPIVMSPMGQDPVSAGVVANWARPAGNVTGVTLLVPEVDGKRVGLLREAIPAAHRIAVLTTHRTPNDEIRTAAGNAGLELIEFSVSGPDEYQTSFEAMRATGAQGLIIVGTPELVRDAEALASFALKVGLPTICASRMAAERGCLIGYGPNPLELYRRAVDYVVRIFQGADPADLPIEGPTHIELVLNVRTARALGISVPEALLARADEVIE